MSHGSILLTGGAGHIGVTSCCSCASVASGWPFSMISRGVFAKAVRDPLIVGKVGDRDAVQRLLEEHAVETVMHFATYTVAPESLREPLKYNGDNTCSTRTKLKVREPTMSARPKCLWPIMILAFSPGVRAQVSASLVAQDLSAQPSHPLTVAVRLEHQPAWHTFWISAGSGIPTSIIWELPAGWSAGGIEWPVPTVIKNSSNRFLGAGYSDVVDLAVTLTVPKDVKVGDVANLKAHVDWDMCAKACQPGAADLSLALPVEDKPPEPNASVRAELGHRVLPESLPGDWQLSASQTEKEVTLTLAGHGGFRGPHFFSEDAYVQYDLPQKIAPVAGKLAFTLPITEKAHPAVPRLRGVLAYTDANGTYHGVRVDVPLPPASKSPP